MPARQLGMNAQEAAGKGTAGPSAAEAKKQRLSWTVNTDKAIGNGDAQSGVTEQLIQTLRGLRSLMETPQASLHSLKIQRRGSNIPCAEEIKGVFRFIF